VLLQSVSTKRSKDHRCSAIQAPDGPEIERHGIYSTLNSIAGQVEMAMLYKLDVREFYGRTSLSEGESQFGGACMDLSPSRLKEIKRPASIAHRFHVNHKTIQPSLI
jgi:hypothetical protein